ncbi:MAG TPA: cardiolipin synthase, partial [Thermoanaerobaculia bacterium]
MSRVVEVPLWVLIALGIALIVVLVTLWSVKRRQDTHLRVADPGELRAMIQSIVGLSHGSLTKGNEMRVIQNGAYFDELLADIAAAKNSVHLETFVWWKGEITTRVAQALAAKAKEGVPVRVLLDASGSSRMDDKLLDLMRASGCKVAKFHPPRLSNLGRMNNRDHRKILVVDGRLAIVAGHGIAQEWTGNAQDKEHWRDTALRIEGPLVNTLQTAFSENWIEETGEVFAGDEYFPVLQPVGDVEAHVAYSSPAGSVSSVELLHLVAIASARKQVLIQNPYFLPDPSDIEVFAAAAKRGVDIRIMMPSDTATDSAIVQHASHHRFGTLLDHGMRIFEFQRTLSHQKVIIVDGIWASVGSTNFDDRSFEVNDEISVGVVDERIAGELIRAWNEDMKDTREWTLPKWRKRSLWHRFVDFS